MPRITAVARPAQELEFDLKVERITAVLLCVGSAFGISNSVLPQESSVLHSPTMHWWAIQVLVGQSSCPRAAAPVTCIFSKGEGELVELTSGFSESSAEFAIATTRERFPQPSTGAVWGALLGGRGQLKGRQAVPVLGVCRGRGIRQVPVHAEMSLKTSD